MCCKKDQQPVYVIIVFLLCVCVCVCVQLKCVPLADGQFVFCVWVCRDLDRDRARNADLNMSTSRPLADPYWTEQVYIYIHDIIILTHIHAYLFFLLQTLSDLDILLYLAFYSHIIIIHVHVY